MFVNKLFTYLTSHISKSKRCLNVKSSTYFFQMKTGILEDFQICISVPLIILLYKNSTKLARADTPEISQNAVTAKISTG